MNGVDHSRICTSSQKARAGRERSREDVAVEERLAHAVPPGRHRDQEDQRADHDDRADGRDDVRPPASSPFVELAPGRSVVHGVCVWLACVTRR
jgi:hypothetical protein